jgi:transposase
MEIQRGLKSPFVTRNVIRAGYRGRYGQGFRSREAVPGRLLLDLPHLAVDVQTTPATTPDVVTLEDIQADLAGRDRVPDEQYADTGYVTPEAIRAAAAFGTVLIGPVMLDSSWQAKAAKGFDRSRFVVDWDSRCAICPLGKLSAVWRDSVRARG